MSLIVHKYGGTSMGSTERIKNVARRVAKWHDAGHQIVVVPSAMSGETNRLLGLAKEITPSPDPRELDMLASTGEQASVALLAIALQSIGKQAVSYTGWQVPVVTDNAYTKARIQSIDDAKVRKDLDAGRIVIITGFQGIDGDGNITTLGRGGSDTSAVAVAAALKAAANHALRRRLAPRPIQQRPRHRLADVDVGFDLLQLRLLRQLGALDLGVLLGLPLCQGRVALRLL
ncbi:MAG: hypothetical protein ACO223_01605, partial [Burkholderiaceae bacterium]